MTSGIRYYSQVEATGYGLAAVAYVRGLVNSGMPVQWVPLVQRGWKLERLAQGETPPLLAMSADDDTLRDLHSLIAATSRPLATNTTLVHTTPENWAIGFDVGCRNVGFTAWESDQLPPHWMPILWQAHAICIPCEFNRKVFVDSGTRTPVHVVPHIRKSTLNSFASTELDSMRQQLGIPKNHFVFYSINTWDPRKNLSGLIRAFARAFTADDPVTLVVKTLSRGYSAAPYYTMGATSVIADALIDHVTAELGRPLPSICLLSHELTERRLDMLHAVGDCYVSLSHGEAWGLGAFDAASRGTPVIMTGWGGQQDFLGHAWMGAVPYTLTPVPIFPPEQPSYWPPQRWAAPEEAAAVELMQSVFRKPEPWLQESAQIKASIAGRFDEEHVIKLLLAALKS